MNGAFLTWSNSIVYQADKKSLQALISQKSTGAVWAHYTVRPTGKLLL